MQRSHILVPLTASLFVLTATAQTGRTMRLLAPVVIGQSSGFVMDHPPSIAGNGFGFAMCSPTFPGAIPVSVPGVVEGSLRLNPLAYGVLGIGVLDSSGTSVAFTFSLPNDPLLVGATFDVQGADVNGAGLMTLTDNDLEVVVFPSGPTPPANLNMVPIAPGTFQMGSPVMPVNLPPYFNQGSAQPVHAVTITRPFWIGKYEVTQAEYLALMGSNPSSFSGVNRPVEMVTWNQAIAYCDALTVQESIAGRLPSGYVYRLPTEAEWEYCCRAGSTTEYHYGSTLSCGQANFWFSYHTSTGCSSAGTAAVGSYAANAWGLHDMHGNVWEWCLDTSSGGLPYPVGPVSDPYEASGGTPAVRGGSWNGYSASCRSAYRGGGASVDYAYDSVGFRVVCAPMVPLLPAPPANLNMVAIAPGSFQMGSAEPVGQPPYYNQANSQPVHLVTITRQFWIGKYEVTQAEYQAVVGTNPSHFTGANLPVESVTWNQAVAYCDALTIQEAAAGRLPSGYEYRLPTEAEWEYCCRAGTTTEYHYGPTLACGQAEFDYSYQTGFCSSAGTAAVGSYAANAWGLHDMHGNVWEWCLDCWDLSANYPPGAVLNPYVSGGSKRIYRGGGWGGGSDLCRSAFRLGINPGGADLYGGFRIVCAPEIP